MRSQCYCDLLAVLLKRWGHPCVGEPFPPRFHGRGAKWMPLTPIQGPSGHHLSDTQKVSHSGESSPGCWDSCPGQAGEGGSRPQLAEFHFTAEPSVTEHRGDGSEISCCVCLSACFQFCVWNQTAKDLHALNFNLSLKGSHRLWIQRTSSRRGEPARNTYLSLVLLSAISLGRTVLLVLS